MSMFPELEPGGRMPRRRHVSGKGDKAVVPGWAQLLLRLARRQDTSIPDLILRTAPRPPACFESQAQWVHWLLGAHHDGKRVVRRVDVGKSAGNRRTWWEVLPVGQQSHCLDCTDLRRLQMRAAQRCFPVRPPRGQADEATETENEGAGK